MNVSNTVNQKKVPYIDWLDPVKAFALLAIILNHFVEEFGPGPWFTNPSENWPDFAVRISNIFPKGHSFSLSLIQFIGWLGDSGPGVFILVSGFGLAWSHYHRKNEGSFDFINFYKRRILRIFPLYIALHFLILAGSLFSSSSSITLASPFTLLSMLGLRFTDGLFFYINPSWWFVWLILQLYIVYPLLQYFINKFGVSRFLIVTFTFTFISRMIGLEGIRYSGSLYYWMTGIFFGTRLAEFALGMGIANLLFRRQEKERGLINNWKILFFSGLIYFIGLVASFTWLGTVISNLLVTAGLTGLFYSLWKLFFMKRRILARMLMWIGIEAYGIYLLHQTPLIWIGHIFRENTYLHVAAALLVILFSFPLAFVLNKAVQYLVLNWKTLKSRQFLIFSSYFVIVCITLCFFVIEPRMQSMWRNRIYALILGMALVWVIFSEHIVPKNEKWILRLFRWAVLPVLFLKLFVFPLHSKAAIITGFTIGLLATILFFLIKSKPRAWIYSIISAGLLFFLLEWLLITYIPLEVGRWGEFPALQKHPTRVYSLKSNQVTHLKYNNYDYILRTNSFGLACPEIGKERPEHNLLRILVIGDAFSMPEGLEYEYSFPALLEKELTSYDDMKNIQVINAGVTGYGPVEQLPQLQELGKIFHPDVVIYQFFINEFKEVHISAEDRLRSIGLIPKDELNHWKLIKESQIDARLTLFASHIYESLARKPAGWRYRKALIEYYETGKKYIYSQPSLDKLKKYLGSMNEFCKQIDSQFIIYFVPGAISVSKKQHISYFPWDVDLSDKTKYDLNRPLEALIQIVDYLNIPLVDLTPYLKNHEKQPVYFPDSWHWNKEGHRVVSKIITEDLLRRGIF